VALARLPVLKRLIPSLRKRWAWLRSPRAYRVVKRDGARFLVNYTDWADRMVIIHGLAERAQVEFFLRAIAERQCTVFLDIGAHMGVYAIMVARRTRCATIMAFEPDPRNFAHLQANLLLNELAGAIDARALALSDQDGPVPFIPGPPAYDVWSKIGEPGAATMSVPAARLDSLVAFTGQSIALKIDIEFHETQAVAGMPNLLQRNRCFMQVECFDEKLPGFTAAMEALGYRLVHEIGVDRYFANAP
jgi:FkbM family methyltransferase